MLEFFDGMPTDETTSLVLLGFDFLVDDVLVLLKEPRLLKVEVP